MLKLAPRNDEAFWLDLSPGVRVQFRPITVAAMIKARRAASKAVAVGNDDTDKDPELVQAAANVAVVRSLAQQGIVAWEGIGNADGEPIVPSPDAIDMLLDHWTMFDAVDALYAFPALARDAEKND